MTGNPCSTPKIPSSKPLCIKSPNNPESRFFVFFQKFTRQTSVDKFVEGGFVHSLWARLSRLSTCGKFAGVPDLFTALIHSHEKGGGIPTDPAP
jgi:hypothetical protein